MPYAYRTKERYTYADYLTWDDAERWELIDGIAYNMTPAPSSEHQKISMELAYRIRSYLEGKRCQVFHAPFDVRLSQSRDDKEHDIKTVVQPDISVICDPRNIDDHGCIGAPDFIIEILSPYTADRDVRDKYFLYETAGVKEYWIVDPGTKTIHAHQLGDSGKFSSVKVYFEDETIESASLPGLIIGLTEIFPA